MIDGGMIDGDMNHGDALDELLNTQKEAMKPEILWTFATIRSTSERVLVSLKPSEKKAIIFHSKEREYITQMDLAIRMRNNEFYRPKCRENWERFDGFCLMIGALAMKEAEQAKLEAESRGRDIKRVEPVTEDPIRIEIMDVSHYVGYATLVKGHPCQIEIEWPGINHIRPTKLITPKEFREMVERGWWKSHNLDKLMRYLPKEEAAPEPEAMIDEIGL